MVDRVQFSPSVGKKNLNEPAASRKSEEAVISTVGGPGAVSGEQKAPKQELLVGPSTARESQRSPAEKAQDQQRELNSLTLAVRRAVKEHPNTQELIRESIGAFLEETQLASEINVPGSGSAAPLAELGGREIESVQAVEQAPAPEVPKTGSAPSVTRDLGGDNLSGARGEVVDVVT